VFPDAGGSQLVYGVKLTEFCGSTCRRCEPSSGRCRDDEISGESIDADWARLPPPAPEPTLVYGGGETRCETAEYLAERGYEVVLVSRSPLSQLARSAEIIYRGVPLKRLAANPRIRLVGDSH
jgi:MoaA/NifB/PqqE/SkfB family radical SAM enzyme